MSIVCSVSVYFNYLYLTLVPFVKLLLHILTVIVPGACSLALANSRFSGYCCNACFQPITIPAILSFLLHCGMLLTWSCSSKSATLAILVSAVLLWSSTYCHPHYTEACAVCWSLLPVQFHDVNLFLHLSAGSWKLRVISCLLTWVGNNWSLLCEYIRQYVQLVGCFSQMCLHYDYCSSSTPFGTWQELIWPAQRLPLTSKLFCSALIPSVLQEILLGFRM